MGCIRKTDQGGWRVDFRDQTGARHRATFETRREAETALSDFRRHISQGTFVAAKEVPRFRQVADEWFAGKREHRPSTQAQWQAHIDRHLLPHIGNLRLDQISVSVIEKLRDTLRRGGLSPQTVNKVLTTATAIFKLAVRRSYWTSNPATSAERLRVTTAELAEDGSRPVRDATRPVRTEEVLSPEELRRLVAAAEPGFYGTLFLTASLTGMRHDELLALRWSDIDLQAGKIFVRRSLSWARLKDESGPVRPRFYEPKTRSGIRTLPVPSELLSALRVWKLQCPKGELDLVFPGPTGAPTHRSNVLRYGLYRSLRRAGLRRVDMHSLRHSFASALIIAGAPVTEVQYLLGHSSPQTTLKVYSHWFTSTQSDSVHRLSRTLAGNFGHFLDTFDRFEGSAGSGHGAEVLDFTRENLAPPAGFEPTAPGLGILCSIHLS
jgi:integrase